MRQKGADMNRLATIAVLILTAAEAVGAGERPASEPYIPGLGEFMSATQVRHAKLWFAGNARNWELAAFELDEIKEGLGDAARVHPTHEGVAVADMIKANLDAPLADLAKVIEAKDESGFSRAFDRLTAGCNACHMTAAHAFIRIHRPTAPPVSNQIFAPGSK
jgi:hypothetical protein